MNPITDNYRFEDFDGDIVISGPSLTDTIVDSIKKTLPAEMLNRLIGWKRTGQ